LFGGTFLVHMNCGVHSCENYTDLPDPSLSSLTGSSIISEQVSHIYPGDRGSRFCWNTGSYLYNYIVSCL